MADAVTLVGALLCVSLGVTEMVAWTLRGTAVLRMGNPGAPMVFNTALALTITGLAVVAVLAGRPTAALLAGLFDVTLAAAVLTEHALGRSLGIDELFVKAYLSGSPSEPGRVAMDTAVCLFLAGTALLLWAPWRQDRHPVILAAAGSLIAAIALVAIFGYVAGTPAAVGWGGLTGMARLTAGAMVLLGVTLTAAAWRESRYRREGLPAWLGMPAGVLALALAAGLWLAVAGVDHRAGTITVDRATGGATVLAVVLACLVGVAVWLAQQEGRQRRSAEAAAAGWAEAEARARGGEHRLFQFLDAMPVGVFVASSGGEPFYANAEAEQLLGRGVVPDVGAGELAETYEAFVAGTDVPYPTDELPVVRALRGESTHVDDQEIHRPGGDVVPLEIWGRPAFGAGGDVDYAIAAFADISERKASQQLLTERAALLDAAQDAIFVWDAEHVLTYWNRGAEQTYGYPSAEAVGRVVLELLDSQLPAPLAELEALLARDGSWTGELSHRRKDGTRITVESRWVPRLGPDGTPAGVMEVCRDVTEAKVAALAVQESELRFRTLFESAPVGIACVSVTGALESVNPQFCEIFGYSRAELASASLQDLTDADNMGEHLAALPRLASGEIDSYSGSGKWQRRDGIDLWLEISGVTVRDADGSPEMLIAAVRDLTAEHDAEITIRTLNDDLERRVAERTAELELTNHNLEAFTFSVSHDLRAPLRALSGFSEALMEDEGSRLDDAGRDYARRIVDASGRMSQLIDDLLGLSRLSRAEMHLESVDLSSEVTDVADQLQRQDPARTATFLITPGVRARADRRLIRTVLENLVGNAWKFTAGRSDAVIEFGTTVTDDGGQCCFVRDNGAGFDAAYIDKLFQPFQRLHSTAEFAGTGIGLASVRRIVERHGGRVWAAGAVDAGATFSFTLSPKETP